MTRLRPRGLSATHIAVLNVIVLAMVVFLTLPGRAVAQGTGRLVGRVTDSSTGSGVSGVAVQVPSLKRGVSTGEDGRYVLDALPAGTYDIRLSHIGYTGGVMPPPAATPSGSTPTRPENCDPISRERPCFDTVPG